jgi:hypothetical protein
MRRQPKQLVPLITVHGNGREVAMKLHKFRVWDDLTKRILTNRELWFAGVDTLNDPLDCRANAKESLEEFMVEYRANTLSVPEQQNLRFMLDTGIEFRDPRDKRKLLRRVSINEYIDEQIAQVGVLSFSRAATDALMWSHYADGHKGLCFEFEADLLWPADGTLKRSDVEYLPAPPFQTMWRDMIQIQRRSGGYTGFGHNIPGRAERFITKGILAKSDSWAYEKEHRMIRASQGAMQFEPSALTRVIFGTRTPHDTKLKVVELLKANGLTHVATAQVEPQANSFRFMVR